MEECAIMLENLVYNYNNFGIFIYHPSEFKCSRKLLKLVIKYQKKHTKNGILSKYFTFLQAYNWLKKYTGPLYEIVKLGLDKNYNKFKKSSICCK